MAGQLPHGRGLPRLRAFGYDHAKVAKSFLRRRGLRLYWCGDGVNGGATPAASTASGANAVGARGWPSGAGVKGEGATARSRRHAR